MSRLALYFGHVQYFDVISWLFPLTLFVARVFISPCRLTLAQLHRLLKDAGVYTLGVTLAQADRLFGAHSLLRGV